MPKNHIAPDIQILRSVQWIGGVIAVLLVLLNLLFAVYLVKSSSMTEMLDLSRTMNASTSVTMARAKELMSGIDPADVAAIVSDVHSILGPIAQSSNISALVLGVRKVAGAINATAVARVVADGASIMHNANAGVGELHLVQLARRVVEIAQIVEPDLVRTILSDIQNTTAETRKIVDGLAVSHNVQLKF